MGLPDLRRKKMAKKVSTKTLVNEAPVAEVAVPFDQKQADAILDAASVDVMADWAYAEMSKVDAEADFGSKWTPAKAAQYYRKTTNDLLSWGAIDLKEKERLNALIADLTTHGEVFSAQAALLAKMLKKMLNKAQKNFDRLLKIDTRGYMDANKDWMACVLGVAKGMEGKYGSALPGEVGFAEQVLSDLQRDNLGRVVSCLTEIANIATCESCGKWVGFASDGLPFEVCRECRDAEKAQKELRDLTLRVAEANKLFQPFEDLLAELDSAGETWVADQVKMGRSKAKIAFDNEFRGWAPYYAKAVKELRLSIVAGAVTEEDVAKIDTLTERIKATIAEIKAFKHLTWCGCGAPTYAPPKGKKAPKDCEACIHPKQADQKTVVKSEAVVTAETADDLAKEGIVVQLAGEESGIGLQRFQKRQVAADREREKREEREK